MTMIYLTQHTALYSLIWLVIAFRETT